MSEIKFKEIEQSLTDKDIAAFEKQYKIDLPNNYKKLVLNFNGGIPINNKKFHCLYSIKYGQVTVEYTRNILQVVEQIIPKEYLPIADDWNGNVFTISTIKEEYGQIFCWYLDSDNEKRKVAETLEDFLKIDSE